VVANFKKAPSEIDGSKGAEGIGWRELLVLESPCLMYALRDICNFLCCFLDRAGDACNKSLLAGKAGQQCMPSTDRMSTKAALPEETHLGGHKAQNVCTSGLWERPTAMAGT
jgi:hypothetical protein